MFKAVRNSLVVTPFESKKACLSAMNPRGSRRIYTERSMRPSWVSGECLNCCFIVRTVWGIFYKKSSLTSDILVFN